MGRIRHPPLSLSQLKTSPKAQPWKEAGSTPEDAAVAYVEALRDGRFGDMIQTFAVESFVEKCDYGEMVKRASSHHVQMLLQGCMSQTNEQPLGVVNTALRHGIVAREVAAPIVTHFAPELANDWHSLSLHTDEEVAEFMETTRRGLEKNPFASMADISIVDPEGVFGEHPVAVTRDKVHPAVAKSLGLKEDELKFVFISFDVDGVLWYFGPDVGRYGDRWYIVHAGGSYATLQGIEATAGGIAPAQ